MASDGYNSRFEADGSINNSQILSGFWNHGWNDDDGDDYEDSEDDHDYDDDDHYDDDDEMISCEDGDSKNSLLPCIRNTGRLERKQEKR